MKLNDFAFWLQGYAQAAGAQLSPQDTKAMLDQIATVERLPNDPLEWPPRLDYDDRRVKDNKTYKLEIANTVCILRDVFGRVAGKTRDDAPEGFMLAEDILQSQLVRIQKARADKERVHHRFRPR